MLKREFLYLKNIIKGWDKKTVTVFLSVAVLQTVSWYFTSRKFFSSNLSDYFIQSENTELYEFLYWFAGDTVVLLVIPVLLIILYFREKPSQYGLSFGDYKTGLKIAAVFIAVMVPVIAAVSGSGDFLNAYPTIKAAKYSWKIFIIYEAGLLVYMAAWEFIWRGFMLFGLYEKFGSYAVLIQMIPFLILHNGKPPVETFGAIIGGVLLGFLALRTRSIFYCIITHFGVMFCIDFISIIRFKINNAGF
jgi:membrane protease YdiL (CAAX protease family)